MSNQLQCFTIEELERLDAHQLDLLKNAIDREIRNSREIRAIIRKKFEPMYVRMASQPRPGAPPSGPPQSEPRRKSPRRPRAGS
jgi:hypothetical protein